MSAVPTLSRAIMSLISLTDQKYLKKFTQVEPYRLFVNNQGNNSFIVFLSFTDQKHKKSNAATAKWNTQ